MVTTLSQTPSDRSSMGKKRRRKHRRGIPSHPAKIMIASVYAGLAALVRLAERRVTNDPKVIALFDGIKQRWDNARTESKKLKKAGVLDFSHILSIEHVMRKDYLGMLWQTTIPYGNTESKRVYNWRQGTIGSLNALLNYAGAMLRSIATKYYSFPKPSYYQVREYKDGSVRIIPKCTAMKFPPEKDVKVYWVAAYPGSSKTPLFRVRHSTLPEMDFVDMIRAHVIELVRQCVIYNVPRKASQRYIRLLIYRLQPFLDWVYTDGATGRSKFWPGADQVLRDIVLEVRATYGRRIGFTPRLTRQIEVDYSVKSTLLDLVRQAQATLKRDSSTEMIDFVQDLLTLMGYWTDKKDKTALTMTTDTSSEMKKNVLKLLKKMGYSIKEDTIEPTSKKKHLTDNDVQEFYSKMLYMTQKEGNDWHRVLFGDMYHPTSMRQVIFAGDNYLDAPTDILIAAEIPILSSYGSGKADLVVFVRRIVAGDIVWTPIMVLDVKTKMGIDWSIIGKKPRTEKKDSRIPSFDVWKRKLTASEWTQVINSTPSSTELEQLKRYEHGLVTGYSDVMKRDPNAPKHLWKGIVIIDPDENQQSLFTLLPGLVNSVVAEIKKGLSDTDSRILFRPYLKGVSKKFQHKCGIVLISSEGPRHLLEKTVPLEHVVEDNPFEERDKEQRIKDNIHFALYLTVASADSSGESAAWIARNWHLLHHLIDLRKSSKGSKQIVWLDLAGELADPLVRNQRFRLIGDQRPKRVSRRKMDSLQGLVNAIGFEDLSEALRTYFFNDSQSGIKDLEILVKECIKSISEDGNIIVIDGWAQIRNMIPSHLDSLVRTLETRLLEWLPKKDMEIIWLDRPVPLPIVSATYQLRRVTPLPHDSPRRQLIDEVIWNLPASPRNLGWRTPRREDIRIIAKDLPTKSDAFVGPFGVPHLRGWAKRFRADSKKERKVSEEEVTGADTGVYGKMFSSTSNYVGIGQKSEEVILDDIYQLVPSLTRIRDKQEPQSDGAAQEVSDPNVEVTSEELKKVTRSKGLWGRASFVQGFQHPRRGRPGTYSSISEVTRGKIRRSLSEPETPSRTSRRPPVVRSTPAEEIDIEYIRHNEVLRVLKTAEFLTMKLDEIIDDKWYGVLELTIKVCDRYFDNQLTSKEALNQLQTLFEKSEISKDLWKDLSSERRFIEGKRIPNSGVQKIIREQPELMTRYGNALFLLVQSVMYEGEPENWKEYAPTLWRAVSDWQWVHMGCTPRGATEGLAHHRFDASALWSNLLWRARHLSCGPVRPSLFERFLFGQLLPVGHDKTWLIFQAKASSKKMVAGLLVGASRTSNLRDTYDTVLDISRLAETAEQTLDTTSRNSHTFILTRFEDMDLIWIEDVEREDGREWILIGNFKYWSPAEGRTAPIRRFTFTGVPYKVIRRIPALVGITIPDDLEERVENTLQRIIDDGETSISVQVNVSMDEQKERYIVLLMDDRGNLLERLEFEKTDEVIGFLRSPISTSDYYKSVDGVLYSWDIKTGISYKEIETASGVVNTSFLCPLVVDSSFLNGKYNLPQTARDVLGTELGDEVLMVASPDLERCRKNWKKCWNVWFLQLDVGAKLRLIERAFLRIGDVAPLFECRQIIDTDTGLRHPTTIAVNKLGEVELSEKMVRLPRLEAYLASRNSSQN